MRELNLFKMDTIGDAYIVAGFLPSPAAAAPPAPAAGSVTDGAGGAEPPARAVCRDVLRLAVRMIEAVAARRAETGRAVHCRVGVSLGPVVAGTLGRLQPRFHLLGPGARSAELHEQARPPPAPPHTPRPPAPRSTGA